MRIRRRLLMARFTEDRVDHHFILLVLLDLPEFDPHPFSLGARDMLADIIRLNRILAVLEDLPADVADRRVDLLLIHDIALRPAFVRLVAQLFGLLDRIENRELAAAEPFRNIVAEGGVARAIAA